MLVILKSGPFSLDISAVIFPLKLMLCMNQAEGTVWRYYSCVTYRPDGCRCNLVPRALPVPLDKSNAGSANEIAVDVKKAR